MKKLLFIVELLCFLVLFSCQNEDDVYYSCDETEDAWVKKNISSIRNMDATEWLSISENLKVPVYRAFSLEQKQTIWMLKLEDTMRNNDWKPEELKHLQQCYNAFRIHPEWLLPNLEKTDEDFDNFNLFAYKWLTIAQKDLGWSNDLISAIIGTANRIKIVDGVALVEYNDGQNRLKNRSEITCNCNTSNVVFTTCSTINCMGGNVCDRVSWGCGLAWTDPCDGLCNK